MPGESFQEKTEKATPKKREKAREEGQVARSIEVPSVLVLLAGITALYISGFFCYKNFLGILRQSFIFDSIPDFNQNYCIVLAYKYILRLILILLPILGAVFLTALVTNFFQVGFYVSLKAIEPKLDKLDIIKGFGRLFSLKSLAELIKSIVKLSVIGVVAYWAVKGEIKQLFKVHDNNTAIIFLFILKGIFKIFIWVVLVMVMVAILDYAFQKWQFEKQMMMSKQEIKDEAKQTEGDPQIKSRIRSLQHQAAKKRLLQEAPKADVIVTNPTHLAIAIRYEPGSMNAPKIIAKGADRIAEKIKEIAHQHDIPVIENKELARNLYKLVEIGEDVPIQLYKAVAELLAYVYKIKGKSL